jgi:hypothetical protein
LNRACARDASRPAQNLATSAADVIMSVRSKPVTGCRTYFVV